MVSRKRAFRGETFQRHFESTPDESQSFAALTRRERRSEHRFVKYSSGVTMPRGCSMFDIDRQHELTSGLAAVVPGRAVVEHARDEHGCVEMSSIFVSVRPAFAKIRQLRLGLNVRSSSTPLLLRSPGRRKSAMTGFCVGVILKRGLMA